MLQWPRAAAGAPAKGSARVRTLLPPLLFLAGFAYYLWHVGPWSGWLDSGELLTAGFHLGVSHPPGQPLHALGAKPLMLLPAGGIAFRGALLSVVAAAACWPVLYLLTRRLMGELEKEPALSALLAAASAVAFGLLAPVVTEATRVEVYGLTLVLLLGVLHLLLRWMVDRDRRLLAAAGLLLGLAAGANPLLAVVGLLGGCVFLFALQVRADRSAAHRVVPPVAGGSRSMALLALGLVIGGAVYLHLPLRTAAGADLAWGAPQTWPSFLATITGAAYGGTFSGGGQPLFERLAGHLGLVGRQLGWEITLLALVGLGLLAARRWRALLLCVCVALGALGTAVAQRIFYPDNPDVSGYLLLALAVAMALAALPFGLQGPRLPPRVEAALSVVGAALLVLAVPAGTGISDGATETYVRAALGTTPTEALLVARSDHAVFPLLYAQRVEGERPDVAVAIAPLLTSSWYLRSLKRWFPALYVPWVDDGRVGRLEKRLIAQNGRLRPVVTEPPSTGSTDLGLLGSVAGVAPARDGLADWRRALPLASPAPLTRKVLGFAVTQRSQRLTEQGRLGAATDELLSLFGERTGWLQGWEAFARARLLPLPVPPSLRPVAAEIPRFSRTFLYSRRRAAWLAGDLLWALGLRGQGDLWFRLSGSPEARVARALHLWRAGAAGPALEELARLGDRARDGRVMLARAEAARGRFGSGLRLLGPLILGGDVGALALAGAWEAQRGQSRRAIAYLRRALAKRPDDVDSLTNLGLLHARAGRAAKARVLWRRAAALPRGKRARALLRRLRAPGRGSGR